MSRYWSKFRCFKGGGSLWTQILGGKGRPPPTIFGTRKVESLSYRMVKKKLQKSSTAWVGCTNVTDRQTTDRQQTTDGRLIAYSERNVVRSLKKPGRLIYVRYCTWKGKTYACCPSIYCCWHWCGNAAVFTTPFVISQWYFSVAGCVHFRPRPRLHYSFSMRQ